MTSISISITNLSLNDINDLASEIGKECEKLIAAFGPENTNEIVTKCITALEMLEVLSNEREKASFEIQDLQDKVRQLEKGKLEKSETQKAFEKVKWNKIEENLRIFKDF